MDMPKGSNKKAFGSRLGLQGLTDEEDVLRLSERDGPLRNHPPSHLTDGRCRYADKYKSGTCPWCLQVANVGNAPTQQSAVDSTQNQSKDVA